MKTPTFLFLWAFAAGLSFAAGFMAGHRGERGRHRYTFSLHGIEVWVPAAGDMVLTNVSKNDRGETTFGNADRSVKLDRVIYVGGSCQSGFLVYGTGLVGVDSSLVRPAP